MTTQDLSPFLKRLVAGETLAPEAAGEAFAVIMSGAANDIQIAAFLTALTMRGATVGEVTGAAGAMRTAMKTAWAPDGAVDLVGTGGDGHGTLNISSAASFVAAGAGVPLAKHGNRNMTSKSGAADVLEALGIDIAMSPAAAEVCLKEAGITFFFAQVYHPAMKYVAAVRKGLGFRTIFNLLGPLSNPAGVKRQVLGVYARRWLVPVAETLRALGSQKAWIAYGSDGMDEITTTGTTELAILDHGTVSEKTIAPEDVGLPRASLADLKGGTAAENAAALKAVLAGQKGPYRDIVLMNAAAALIVADKAADLSDGVTKAAAAIDGGAAMGVLEKLIEVSNRAP
jgi:anthranilate phosphoribosyltransferase